MVWRLDRLAGSERTLIETLQDLDQRQVDIRSLTEPLIDTTSPMGRALYGIVAVFAQVRVNTIRDNTRRTFVDPTILLGYEDSLGDLAAGAAGSLAAGSCGRYFTADSRWVPAARPVHAAV